MVDSLLNIIKKSGLTAEKFNAAIRATELYSWRIWLIDKLPHNVSFDVGAKVHILANTLSALKAASLKPGARVLIAAATGGMVTATLKLAIFF